MEVIATIDQGTQSTRVYVYDSEAKPIASHHVEFKQHRARAGYGFGFVNFRQRERPAC